MIDHSVNHIEDLLRFCDVLADAAGGGDDRS